MLVHAMKEFPLIGRQILFAKGCLTSVALLFHIIIQLSPSLEANVALEYILLNMLHAPCVEHRLLIAYAIHGRARYNRRLIVHFVTEAASVPVV